MSEEIILALENLQTYYGKIHALRGINVQVRKGQIVTLLGSNGAGKSTTLKTISGITAGLVRQSDLYGTGHHP